MQVRTLLLFCLTFPLLTGWGHWGPEVKVGVALDRIRDREVFVKSLKDELEDNRAEFLLKDAQEDPTSQEKQVKDLIAQGVQALILLPVDPQKAAPLVEAAHQAGIKVISLERLIPTSGLDYFIAFNPEKAGELQAKAMVKVASRGKYVFLASGSDNWANIDFAQGQMKILKPLSDGGPIQIVTANPHPLSTKEPDIEKILKEEGTQTAAVLADNNQTAQQAVQARDKAGLSSRLPLAGVGEDLETCRRIASGRQTLTLYHPPKKLAAEAAYLTAKVARKATEFDCQFTDVENGGGMTKAVLLTPVVVDAKNLDSTIIQDGVQKKEEVYGKDVK